MPEAVFQQYVSPAKSRHLRCVDMVGVIQAARPDEVPRALQAVQRAADSGLYAAGYIAYEAAAGLDAAFCTHSNTALPLVWFGLFHGMVEQEPAQVAPDGQFAVGPWRPDISPDDYRRAIDRIKGYIASGDTYQVNFTFRLHSAFSGQPWPFFLELCQAQRAGYCAYIDTGPHVICSASPELFFNLADGLLTCLPMKGTAPRGLTYAQDARLRSVLAASAKNRAENAMIVDMMRNDLGRIAEVGSVAVTDAFAVAKYPTLFQMTSAVTAASSAAFPAIIKALFPCASITGAPKIRTMQIIRELEAQPRGVYTGCVGYVAPGGTAQFNVAIRTVTIDRSTGQAQYGVGGGIVWDSQTTDEYAECLTKTQVLTARRRAFDLLETMLWEPDAGYFLIDGHLRRLEESAEYFDFPLDLDAVRRCLDDLTLRLEPGPQRVRLLIDNNGRPRVEHSPLMESPRPFRLRLAKRPIDSRDVFLYHKTTCRAAYEAARSGQLACDDTLLWNERHEVTETTIANIVARLGGQLYTPPVESGLLSGVFRDHLLRNGQIREQALTVDDVLNAQELFAINSVRKWMPAMIERE